MTPQTQIVLTSNGPGELYTWAKPVLDELHRRVPEARTVVSLIPCQFATGSETEIARSFPVDAVTSPSETMRAVASPAGNSWFTGAERGAVISLGGNATLAIQLGKRLGYPVFRYGFEPQWNPAFTTLFLADASAGARSRHKGAPAERVLVVGNLVADAVQAAQPIGNPGTPHIMVFPGSRDVFARGLVPFLIEVVDRLGQSHPGARFVWPVSRLLDDATIAAGIAGDDAHVLGGVAGTRDGDSVLTPGGTRIDMIGEDLRHAHMRAADLAITIPGTNTLELGIVGVPSVVILPMNRPELIPLEGVGHWLGLLPVVGRYLKRYAVRLFVEGLNRPISLPNRFSGEDIFVELAGRLTPADVAASAHALLSHPEDLANRRRRLAATMPGPGAAEALVARVMADMRGLDEARARQGLDRG